MTRLTDGRRIIELSMKGYVDGSWTPDWSGDFVGNSGEAKWDRDVYAYLLDGSITLEDFIRAAENANETEFGDAAVTSYEVYSIGSQQASNKELLWAYGQMDAYDLDAEHSICKEIIRRAGLEDRFPAADGEEFEEIIEAAFTILEAICA